jgi:uroporphyrinogen-III synthase
MVTEQRPDLSGLRILVPRPQRENDTFIASLNRLNATVTALPVMAIEPLVVAGQASSLMLEKLREADHLVVISRPAAEVLCQILLTHNIRPSSILAVGASTAKILEASGFKVDFPVKQQASEGVLNLPQLSNVKGQKIVLVKGQGGRPKLADALRQSGAFLEQFDCYRRQPLGTYRDQIIEQLTAQAVDVVALHSVEILENLLALLSQDEKQLLQRVGFLVPGERVAQAVIDAGLAQVIVADSALPQTMVDALVGWYTSNQTTILR